MDSKVIHRIGNVYQYKITGELRHLITGDGYQVVRLTTPSGKVYSSMSVEDPMNITDEEFRLIRGNSLTYIARCKCFEVKLTTENSLTYIGRCKGFEVEQVEQEPDTPDGTYIVKTGKVQDGDWILHNNQWEKALGVVGFRIETGDLVVARPIKDPDDLKALENPAPTEPVPLPNHKIVKERGIPIGKDWKYLHPSKGWIDTKNEGIIYHKLLANNTYCRPIKRKIDVEKLAEYLIEHCE